MIKRKWSLTIAVTFLVLAVASLSKPGSDIIKRVFPFLRSGNPVSHAESLSTQGLLDVEQLARQQHGWHNSIVDSVVSGQIIYYDENGLEVSNADITIHRMYPNLLRVEINWGDSSELTGVDELGAWRASAEPLTPEEARDIRAFLRIWPERLFVVRDSGTLYREAGNYTQDHLPATPTQEAVELDSPIEFSQVEIIDSIQDTQIDERRIYFYVSNNDSVVNSLSYLEPDDPQQSQNDPETDLTEVRVDFDNWVTVDVQIIVDNLAFDSQVLLPMEITHWTGGKVDFRIVIENYNLNQGLLSSLFQRP